jgi:transcriptional regulator with XRE-family HTH domain/KaiC/GvpD/RAD55 family RecA-like ATPase
MNSDKTVVTSGVDHLDQLLGGGIIIGDNVVWYDDAGSLAFVFCLNLIRTSLKQKKSLIYVCFDHSPKNLLEKLGSLAQSKYITILDCFTNGKGQSSDIFKSFYRQKKSNKLCPIIKIDEPHKADHVAGAFYGLHKTMTGDVRFVFDSLTGMQELWGGEEDILRFYSHSCPRLYELNTIAYWIIERGAHSQRTKVHINKITQVAIDLSLNRGKTSLTILKADKRDLDIVNKPAYYWNKGLDITFDSEKSSTGRTDLGIRLKELRTKKGISQTKLAKLVGVTPSTISQVESNQIYPSVPALIKIAEILSVQVSSFFNDSATPARRVVFPGDEAVDVQLPGVPKESVRSKLLTSVEFDSKTEPYLLEIPPGTKISSHFFIHKGEETGYLLSGELLLKLEKRAHHVHAGDLVCLTSETPQQWENQGTEPAILLWIKIR